MVDRVKYFLLGLLFLVVAGVIAYDRWNAPATPQVGEAANRTKAEVKGAEPPKVDPETLAFPTKPKPEDDAELLRDRKGPDAKPAKQPVKPDRKPQKKPKKPKKQPARVHIVKSGENLEKIALYYYKTRAGIDWIVRANGLKDRNRIFLNQKLIIPARKESVSTKKTKPVKIPSRYEVKEGDGNLYRICARFYGSTGQGARIAKIMEMNKLWSADVKAGTILTLPPK